MTGKVLNEKMNACTLYHDKAYEERFAKAKLSILAGSIHRASGALGYHVLEGWSGFIMLQQKDSIIRCKVLASDLKRFLWEKQSFKLLYSWKSEVFENKLRKFVYESVIVTI